MSTVIKYPLLSKIYTFWLVFGGICATCHGSNDTWSWDGGGASLETWPETVSTDRYHNKKHDNNHNLTTTAKDKLKRGQDFLRMLAVIDTVTNDCQTRCRNEVSPNDERRRRRREPNYII